MAGAGLLLTGCLVPSDYAKFVYDYNGPDPAIVPVAPGQAQVYTSNATIWLDVEANVPTFSWDYATSTQPVHPAIVSDALPQPPWWVTENSVDGKKNVWAPTVRYVAGRYLMMFSASREHGSHCIGAATSATASGVFNAATLQWCDADPSVGWLDPQIFQDPTGGTHLYWSRQWQEMDQGDVHYRSEIVHQELAPDGLTRLGEPAVVVTFDEVAEFVGRPLGPRPYIENPSMVKDPHNNYNLLVSIGTWNGNVHGGDDIHTYHTFELPCLHRSAFCLPAEGERIPLNLMTENAQMVTRTGGASLLFDATPQNNVMVFHANTGYWPELAGSSPQSEPYYDPDRRIWWMPTLAVHPNDINFPVPGPLGEFAELEDVATRDLTDTSGSKAIGYTPDRMASS